MEELKIVTDLCVALKNELKNRIRAGMYIVPEFDPADNDYVIYVNLYNNGEQSCYKFTRILDHIKYSSQSNSLVNQMADHVYVEYKKHIHEKYFVK